MQVADGALNYTTVAGETILSDPDGTQRASIFSTAYTVDGNKNASNRPLTFVFNGGPGCASVFLHLGVFGPKRIEFPPDASIVGGPPYKLVDNTSTLLRYSDLVFVDPVGTGYSRALGKKKDSDFWGVDEDANSIAEFIRLFLTRNKRWNSPLFLAGESYGTIRASELVKTLELNVLNSVNVNGVILISAGVDVRSFAPAGPGNELPYVADIPTYAATAYYHDALPEKPQDLNGFLEQAREFASTEYLTALFEGDSITEQQAGQIAEKLHHFTGLSVDYLRRTHLKIDNGRFLKELLRSRGQVLAIHDTRYVGKDPDEAGEGVLYDPFMFGTTAPFVMTINNYLTADLDVKMDEPYTVFSMEANQGWKRAGDEANAFAGYLNTTANLAQAAATNKDFRVFVASGIYDLATPFFATEYAFHHSGIPKDRILMKNYEGGHMMYLYGPSREKLSEDIAGFITAK